MLVMLEFLVVGLVLGLVSRGSLRSLQDLRVRGEWFLIGALVLQAALPIAIPSSLGVDRIAVLAAAWVAPVSIAFAVAAWNWRIPGFSLLALGLGLNLVVVTLNQGMPVHVGNAVDAGAVEASVRSALDSSWLHIPVRSTTEALMLADVIPLAGPPWHRGMLSLGDVMIAVGAGLVVFIGMHRSVEARHNLK